MFRFFAFAVVVVLTSLPMSAAAQEIESSLVRRSAFHSEFLKAVRDARKSGEISLREALELRIASASPAFRKHAKKMMVVQMAFSGEDGVPMHPDGRVDVASIDWEGLTNFIKTFLPILLEILREFGVFDISISNGGELMIHNEDLLAIC